jgi:hypothetical protein
VVAPEDKDIAMQQPLSLDELAVALERGDLSPSEALRIAGEEIGAIRDEAQPLHDTLEGFELTETLARKPTPFTGGVKRLNALQCEKRHAILAVPNT